jgi:hypothetical protein
VNHCPIQQPINVQMLHKLQYTYIITSQFHVYSFNHGAHKKTRSVVERGIGQLKRRFHVLHGEIRICPYKPCKVIIACCILHNICKARLIPRPHGGGDDAAGNDDGAAGNHQNGQTKGMRYRLLFAETHVWNGKHSGVNIAIHIVHSDNFENWIIQA